MRVGQPQAARVLGDVLGAPEMPQADGLEEVLVLVDAVQAHAQEAVLALELADAAEVLVAGARTRPLDALVKVVDQVVLADGQKRLVHGQVDALALAGLLGLVQSRQRRGGDHQRIEVVARVGSGEHGLLLRAVLHDDAGVGHHRQVVGGALHHLGVALLAEAGDVYDDHLGVELPQHVVGDALASPRAALGGLHEDVGVLHEVEEHLLALFGEVVQGHRALVAALGLLHVRGVADSVARARVLEPDDVGTPVGHEVGGLRAGQLHCRVHDLDAVERAVRGLFGRNCHG